MLYLVALVAAVALLIWLLRRQPKANTLVFLGSGGHTGEMLRILQNLDLRGQQLHLVYSAGDEFSLSRAAATLDVAPPAYAVPRARHVGQPLWRAVGGALGSLIESFLIVWRVRPSLMLCNGPGTCVMLVVAMKTLALVGLVKQGKIIYVESFARVESLSLTGKLLLRVADEFIVQWQPLHAKYPTTRYIGVLV